MSQNSEEEILPNEYEDHIKPHNQKGIKTIYENEDEHSDIVSASKGVIEQNRITKLI